MSTPNARSRGRLAAWARTLDRDTLSPVTRARLDRSLSLPALSRRAGVSVSQLHLLERGRINAPRAKTIAAVARVLDLAPEEVRNGCR